MFMRSVEVLIDRPVGEVFEFVQDARNRPRWDESVDSEELTSALGMRTPIEYEILHQTRQPLAS
jgi:hypothetical protein